MLVAAWVLVGCAIVTSLAYFVAGWLTVRRTAKPLPKVAPEALPPVTLLKPLKGVEEGLERNLRSFYLQDYPQPFEVIFATTEDDDPALEVARKVAAEHPAVPTRFVVSDPDWGLNPKVSNLKGAVDAAAHDLMLQTDANVWVPPDYLRRIVTDLEGSGGHLLSSMVVGVGEQSVGAALDNVHLSAFIVPGTTIARDGADITIVIGKSMLMRRSVLDSIGGLATVKDLLAEDYVLGHLFVQAGLKVILSSVPVFNVNVHSTVERFVARHVRWLKMRVVCHLPGFMADLLGMPVAFAALAVLAGGLHPVFLAVFGATVLYKILLDLFLVRRTRGEDLPVRYALLSPVKDLMMLPMWLFAVFSRSVEWRGRRLRLGRMSYLRPDDGALPVRIVRVLVSPFRARA